VYVSVKIIRMIFLIIQRKIEIVFGKAKDIGIKTIHLEVVTKIEKAYGFYEKIGFRDRNHHLLTRTM
jgi:hypothetical protein